MNRALHSLAVLASVAFVSFGTDARAAIAMDLERAVDAALARIEAATTDPLLAPEPSPAPTDAGIVDRRRTAIARSVLTLQARTDSTLAVLEGDVLSMLSLARNHRHLGMRRRALRLYDLTVLADREHEYTREILHERLVCAIELSDSASVMDQAAQIAERADAAAYGASLADALAYVIAVPSMGDAARRLVDRVQAVPGLDHPLCLARVAQARQLLGEHLAAHAIYRNLVLRARVLDTPSVAIALMGLADSALASGEKALARALYDRYRARDTGRLGAWSTYQLGNMAANAGELDRAVAFLRSICEREERTPWQESACTRLAQVRQLQEIGVELRPYGRDLDFTGRNR